MGCASENELFILYVTTASCALCSLLGSLFIIIIYFAASEIRVYPFKLVAYLAFCDSIKSVALIIPGYSNSLTPLTCTIQGFILDSFSLSNLIWIFAISYCLQKVIICNHDHIEVYHKYWLILSFVVCPALCIFPLLTNSYGSVYGWCTLTLKSESEVWRITLDYIPRWVSIFLILICYFKIYNHIKRNPGIFADAVEQHIFLRRIIAYPGIILVAFIPLTILRVLQTIESDECSYFALGIFAYICFGSYGLLNAIAYGYNETIYQYLYQLCHKGSKIFRPRGTDLFSTLSDGIIIN